MNLNRIRIDSQGLIIQDKKGSLSRIGLSEKEISGAMQAPEREIRNLAEKHELLKPLFRSDGSFDARIDVIPDNTDFLSRPLRIYYGIEPRCNLKCTFCGPRDFHEGVKPVNKEFEDFLLHEFFDIGVFQIQLTGGEIGLRGYDLLNTVEKTKELGFGIILSTNGMWKHIENKERFIEKLSRYDNIIQIKVSIEGPPEYHEAKRRGGSFNETIDTLEKLVKYQLNPRINATIFKSSCNRQHLTYLAELAKRYGVGLMTVPLRVFGKASDQVAELPPRDLLRDYTIYATELRGSMGVNISFNFDIIDGKNKIPIFDLRRAPSCGAPLMGPHITHTGETYPCGFLQEVPNFMMGKVERKGDLLDIWQNSKILNYIRDAGKSKECQSCNLYGKQCWGGVLGCCLE